MNVILGYNGLSWYCGSIAAWEMLGYIPEFIRAKDERDVVTQINDAYSHGGGWRDFNGFTLSDFEEVGFAHLDYAGDPPMMEVGRAIVGNETVIVFQYAWVAVVQNDTKAYRVARLD